MTSHVIPHGRTENCAHSSSPRLWAGDWDAAMRGCWSSSFSVLSKCTFSRSGNYQIRAFPTRITGLFPAHPVYQQGRSKQAVRRTRSSLAAAARTSLQPYLSCRKGSLPGAYLSELGQQQRHSSTLWPALPSSLSHGHHRWSKPPPCGVTRSTRQDSATDSSFSLCHSKITAKTEKGDISLLQRSIREILVTPHTEILCLPCITQCGRDKKCQKCNIERKLPEGSILRLLLSFFVLVGIQMNKSCDKKVIRFLGFLLLSRGHQVAAAMPWWPDHPASWLPSPEALGRGGPFCLGTEHGKKGGLRPIATESSCSLAGGPD